ncbi:MAG: hypothetical protein DRR06_19095 [Gammaproteobacteria bacterium]|nr:MAG: hypothetical protein DRR06_19095 [Gammaproteobacteria bacterium]
MSNQKNTGLKGSDLLAHFEDNWQTDIGAAIIGKERIVLRGRDLLSECRDFSWMELMVFAITGKESPKLARLLEGMWVISTSFPDPRLWNNRVAALGGTARTTGALALSAASAVSEADAYGLRVTTRSIDMLFRFKRELDAGGELGELITQEFKQYRVVSGYGRPLVSKDERVKPLLEFAKSIGLDPGPYVKLAFDIADYLSNSRYRFQINVSAVIAALMADEGVSPENLSYFGIFAFIGGMYPCHIDAKNHPEGALFPLSTSRINYTGPHIHRTWNKGHQQ